MFSARACKSCLIPVGIFELDAVHAFLLTTNMPFQTVERTAAIQLLKSFSMTCAGESLSDGLSPLVHSGTPMMLRTKPMHLEHPAIADDEFENQKDWERHCA